MKSKFILVAALLVSSFANAQTKKVVLEDYTGIHCQFCPDGTIIIDSMRKLHPSNFIPIAIHTGTYEPTSSPLYAGTVGTDLITAAHVDSIGYPAGCVDRKRSTPPHVILAMNRGYWINTFNTRAAMTAIVSVSFSHLIDSGSGKYSADVNVNFSSAPTSGVPLKLQVYIIEDSIAATGAVAQTNEPNGPHNGQNPLSPWWHNHTFRKSVSGDTWGFSGVIPSTPTVGTTYTKHITFTTDASWVTKQVYLVGYVAYDGSAANDQKEILNAEEVKLTSFFPASVNNINNVRISQAYPNPAHLNDILHVEYNAPTSGLVVMNVYNAVGQLVATPNKSNEVAGTHTIQWRASDYNLPAGNYFIQISTSDGTGTQKVTLY